MAPGFGHSSSLLQECGPTLDAETSQIFWIQTE